MAKGWRQAKEGREKTMGRRVGRKRRKEGGGGGGKSQRTGMDEGKEKEGVRKVR